MTMETSALVAATTVFVVDALLLPAMLSEVVEIVAVMGSDVPAAVAGLTCTTGLKVAVAPLASEAMVQVIVPPEPTAGVTHDQPAGTAIDWKFVPVGRGMETLLVVAVDGPPFVATTV